MNKILAIIRAVKRALKYDGNLVRKCTYFYFSLLAIKNDVIYFRVDRIASEYSADWFDLKEIPQKTKKWAYKKGYASYKFQWYGLNQNNYSEYISDFDFYSKYNYQNREFEALFEHKLNTYYLLSPFKDQMPIHYYYICKCKIIPINAPVKRNGTIDDIINLVKKQPIAAKACKGGHGAGFYKLECIDGIFYANHKKYSENEFVELISNLDNYIITDYSKPHPIFIKLCGENTFAVIRTITVYDDKDGAQLTGAVIRLGCKKAGILTDYPGTIYCGLTLDEGRLFNPIYRERDDWYVPHPDTREDFNLYTVPHWSKLKKIVLDISNYIPMTPYLVMDIIPSEDGFNILEINSHGQVRITEAHYPFLNNLYNRRIFKVKER